MEVKGREDGKKKKKERKMRGGHTRQGRSLQVCIMADCMANASCFGRTKGRPPASVAGKGRHIAFWLIGVV